MSLLITIALLAWLAMSFKNPILSVLGLILPCLLLIGCCGILMEWVDRWIDRKDTAHPDS